MAEKRTPLTEHHEIEWVDPPQGIQSAPSRFSYRWKWKHGGMPSGEKSRVRVQGFHEADTGADKETPVATQETVYLLNH